MSGNIPNKVDMSLDDIIKISKAQKRQNFKASKQQKRAGRGGGRGLARGQARGLARGQVGGLARGQNRGLARGQVGGLARGQVGGLARGQVRGGRQGQRGRGRGRGKFLSQNSQLTVQQTPARGANKRGRGRGVLRKNVVVNPLNRISPNQNLRGRGRGRGKILARGKKTLVFSNSLKPTTLQTGKKAGQQQTVQQAAKLLREKQMALKNLQQAKQNMKNINQALQKSSRDNLVNQKRGIVGNENNTIQAGRGRGRRKLLAPLMSKPGNVSPASSRQLIHTSVTISNPSALNTAVRGRKRRGWRKGPNQGIDKGQFTIQVPNQSVGNIKTETSSESLVDQLKMLKPAVSTVYKFQKSVFATPATGMSLSERFASSSAASTVGSIGGPEGRKVFM